MGTPTELSIERSARRLRDSTAETIGGRIVGSAELQQSHNGWRTMPSLLVVIDRLETEMSA